MNYRLLFLTSLLAVAIQGCQGSRNNAPSGNGSQKTDATAELKGACENPITMKVQDGEKEIQLADLATGKDGRYQLIATEYFSALENESGGANNLHFLGSEMKVDKDLQDDVTADDKIEVLCATKPTEKSDKVMTLSGNLMTPNAIETADGSVHQTRHDQVVIENGKAKTTSVVSAGESKITKTDEKKPKGLKILVVQKDNGEVTIKMQYDTLTNDKKRGHALISATYRLQKAE